MAAEGRHRLQLEGKGHDMAAAPQRERPIWHRKDKNQTVSE